MKDITYWNWELLENACYEKVCYCRIETYINEKLSSDFKRYKLYPNVNFPLIKLKNLKRRIFYVVYYNKMIMFIFIVHVYFIFPSNGCLVID